MFRYLILLTWAAILALGVTNCRESDVQAQKEHGNRQTAREVKSLGLEMEQASLVMQRIRADQMQMKETLDEMQDRLDHLAERARVLSDNLELTGQAPAAPAKAEKPAGWPLPVKLLLVLAIIVILYMIYKRVTREEEEEDVLDEEYLEENEMGAIRYPPSVVEEEQPGEERVEREPEA